MEKFRWCFIGSGRLANKIAPQILASGRHEIVSVYSRRMESAQAFAEKFGCAACETAEEAINRPDVDGVYVVTPHSNHYKYAKLAMELGKPVLCEKALTLRPETTEELFDIAKEKNVYLCEAMWTWFGEPANRAKAWLPELGGVTDAEFTYRCYIADRGGRVMDLNLGAGALLDIGIYPVTYLYRLFGKPEKTVCEGRLENGLDMGEEISFTFPGGVTARVSVAMDEKNEEEHMTITGERGKMHAVDYHYSSDVTLCADGKSETFTGVFGYVREFDTVADEIRRGLKESEFVPPQATIDVMHIMDDCLRQMGVQYPDDRN